VIVLLLNVHEQWLHSFRSCPAFIYTGSGSGHKILILYTCHSDVYNSAGFWCMLGTLDSAAAAFLASRSSIRTTCPMLQFRHKTVNCRVCQVMHRPMTRQLLIQQTAVARLYHFCVQLC